MCLLVTFLKVTETSGSQFLMQAETGRDDPSARRGKHSVVSTLTCKEACNQFASSTPVTPWLDEKAQRLMPEYEGTALLPNPRLPL